MTTNLVTAGIPAVSVVPFNRSVKKRSIQQSKASNQDIARIRKHIDSAIKGIEKKPDALTSVLLKLPGFVKYLISIGVIGAGVFLLNPWLVASGFLVLGGAIALEGYAGQFESNQQLIDKIKSIGKLLENRCLFYIQQTERLQAGVLKLSKQNKVLFKRCTSLKHLLSKLKSEVNGLNKVKKDYQAMALKQKACVKSLKGKLKTLDSKIICLNKTVKTLKSQTQAQKKVVKALKKTEQAYNKMKKQYQKNLKDLDKSKTVLKKTSVRLASLSTTLASTKDALTDTSTAMEATQVELSKATKEVGRLKVISQTLKGTVEEFSALMIEDEHSRKAFIERLEDILDDKSKSFIEAVARISKAEADLHLVKDELAKRNQEYQSLLKVHQILLGHQGNQIHRLEQLARPGLKRQGQAIFLERQGTAFFKGKAPQGEEPSKLGKALISTKPLLMEAS